MLKLSFDKDSRDVLFEVTTESGTIYNGRLKLTNSTLRNNFNRIRTYFVNAYNHSPEISKVLDDFFIKIHDGYFNLYSVSIKKKLEVLHGVSEAIYKYLITFFPIESWYKHANVKKEEVTIQQLHDIVRYIASIIVGSIIFDSYRNLSIRMYDKHTKTIEFLRTFIVSKTLTLNSFSQFYFYNLFMKDETDVVSKTLNFINLMYSILITKDLDKVENFFGFLLTTYRKSLENYEKSYINLSFKPDIADEMSVTEDIILHLNTELTFENFVRTQNDLYHSKTISQSNKQQFNIIQNFRLYTPSYLTYLVNNILENLNFSRVTLEKYQVLTQYFLHIALKNLDLKTDYDIELPLKALRYVSRADTNKLTTSDRTKIITGIMNELQKHLDSVLSYTHHIEKLGILSLEKRVIIEDMFIGKPIPPTENVVRNLVEFMKFYILFMEKKELRDMISEGLYENKLFPSRKNLSVLLQSIRELV